jgi:hypothetical protein
VYRDPRRFGELPYQMYNTELQMEFYLWLVRIFCLPGSSVFSMFAGSKLTCAALVSRALKFRLGRPDLQNCTYVMLIYA